MVLVFRGKKTPIMEFDSFISQNRTNTQFFGSDSGEKTGRLHQDSVGAGIGSTGGFQRSVGRSNKSAIS